MLVSVCGTPCSGKTTSSEGMKEIGWQIVSDRCLIEALSLFEGTETDTSEMIVDLDVVRNGFHEWRKNIESDTILEGHLSYLAPYDLCLIMRLDPSILRARLESRGYSDEKIRDNVGAEILGYVTTMAMKEEDRRSDKHNLMEHITYERDVTGMTPAEVREWFIDVIDNFTGESFNRISIYRPGNIDWLEVYSEWC